MAKIDLTYLLGKMVEVYVDRPLGSSHPNYPDLVYKLNYGYIKELVSLDGEFQDAYIIGVDKVVSRFKGKVVAIISRKNDQEDKLVVCPFGLKVSREEIIEQVLFQECYFEFAVIMEV